MIWLDSLVSSTLPDASAVLFQGNRDALKGFAANETAQPDSLLTRLIVNLDRIAGAAEE